MAKAEKSAPRNIHQEVTDRILAELENGALPWVKPWKSFGVGNTPRNAATKRPYSGGNVVMLWMEAEAKGYTHPLWLTFKQATDLKANVRKGEKGTPIYYMSTFNKTEDNGSGDEVERRIPFLRSFTVFNIAQCENLPEGLFERPAPINEDERNALAEEFCDATKAKFIEGQGEAYYRPSGDLVSMPRFEAFKNADNYYSTKFHELGHWTGAETRLNRNIKNRFGSVDYAFEELVAELTAAFCCAEFGFDGETRHAGYIQSWIKLLKDDSRAFIRAASAASKAHGYLRDLALAEGVLTASEGEDEANELAQAA